MKNISFSFPNCKQCLIINSKLTNIRSLIKIHYQSSELIKYYNTNIIYKLILLILIKIVNGMYQLKIT